MRLKFVFPYRMPEGLKEADNAGFALKRTIALALCFACSMSITTTSFTIGPLSAKSIGGADSLATFTLGAFTFATAISALCAGPIFSKVGRYKGFLIGDVFFVMGSVLGMISIHLRAVWLEFVAFFCLGIGTGISAFLRFAAVELSSTVHREKAITYVLLGGILAGIIGPLGSSRAITLIHGDKNRFIGSFLVVFILVIIKVLLLSTVDFTRNDINRGVRVSMHYGEKNSTSGSLSSEKPSSNLSSLNAVKVTTDIGKLSEPLKTNESNETLAIIVRRPQFVASVILSTLAHTVMIMIMSAVTLAMTIQYDYSIKSATDVILVHTVAMFLPGLYTGTLISKFGVVRIASCGAVLYVIATIILLLSSSLASYYIGMMFVGIGWNLGYSSGSVLLLTSYKPKSKLGALVQSRHDCSVFTVAGTASMVTGAIYAASGWEAVLLTTSIMVFFQVCIIAYIFKIRRTIILKELGVIRQNNNDNNGLTLDGIDRSSTCSKINGECNINSDDERKDSSEDSEVHDTMTGMDVFNSAGLGDMRASIDGGVWIDDNYVSSMDNAISEEIRKSQVSPQISDGNNTASKVLNPLHP